jgi:hypothetical protein
MKKILLTITVCALSLYALPVMAQTTYHVNINSGNDTNDGLKWSTAFENLQAAIDVAQAGDEILIAEGTYYPTKKIADVYGSSGHRDTPTTDRHRSFMIYTGIKIYGGFPAAATDVTSMNSRNWKRNKTILSGDFNDDDGDNFDNMEENAHNVVIMFNADPSTVLDGFYITGGCANDIATTYIEDNHLYYVTGKDGGGIYAYSPIGESSPTISNISFYGNYAEYLGGAVYNYSFESEASPKMTNVSFLHNKANTERGGGLFNDGRTVHAELTNLNVVGNESFLSGGGLYFVANNDCSPKIINTVINGNYSHAGYGGGIYMTTYDGNAAAEIINSTICGNKVSRGIVFDNNDGGGLYIDPAKNTYTKISNTVIWGNKGVDINNLYIKDFGSTNVITSSLIEDPIVAGNNAVANLPFDTDPKFLDPVSADFAPTMDGDYQLTLESPLINKGSNLLMNLSTDLLGNTRIVGGVVDIGAYESQGSTPVDNESIFSEKAIWSYSGNLYVRISKPTTLRVYSLDGMLVKQENNLGTGAYQFPLPKGVYIVTLDNGSTEKVIIR